jgi:hypothetical protein
MRVLKEFIFGPMKFSIFSFNEKWILKTEVGLCEQTFKFPHEEFEIESVEAYCNDPEFQSRIHARFQDMHADLSTLTASN